MDRAVIEHRHHRPARPAGPGLVAPVEAGQKIGEVARALGSTGDHGSARRWHDRARPAEPASLPGPAPPPADRRHAWPSNEPDRAGQRFELAAEHEADVGSRGLLLQESVPQVGAVDRIGLLPALRGVPHRRCDGEPSERATPALASVRRTTLRWPEEIVWPLRASISRASRVSVQSGPSAAGLLSTSRATVSAAARLRGVRPARGRERKAAIPCHRPSPAPHLLRPHAETRPDHSTAVASERPQHGPARRSARKLERLSRSSLARPASLTTNMHRRPIKPSRSSVAPGHLGSCAFISGAAWLDRDPEPVAKLCHLVGFCMRPPAHGLILSMDETSRIQAPERMHQPSELDDTIS